MRRQLDADIQASGGAVHPEPGWERSIGATMFDLPGSEDGTITVLLPQNQVQRAPSQALLRIESRKDGRTYLGIVVAGPFAEPDSLKGDSTLLVTVLTRGGVYLPPYHGRVKVQLLGERLADGSLGPPRLRPLPNSLVFPLDDAEAAEVLHAGGAIRLGSMVGHEEIVVGVPPDQKSVLPRHTAVLGHHRRRQVHHDRPPGAAGTAGRHGGDPAGCGGRVHLPARADRGPADAGRAGGARHAACRGAGGLDVALPPGGPRDHQ